MKLIAIALLRPGWEEDYNGNPAIQTGANLDARIASGHGILA